MKNRLAEKRCLTCLEFLRTGVMSNRAGLSARVFSWVGIVSLKSSYFNHTGSVDLACNAGLGHYRWLLWSEKENCQNKGPGDF
jgi:hypothetical protein